MKRSVKCPRCGAQILYSPENPYRPFCSERCRWIDLGQWASEKYVIPGKETSPNEVNQKSSDVDSVQHLDAEPPDIR